MNFEKSRDCNYDKVNHDKTLLKYSNSCISRKNFKMNFEKSRECDCDKINHEKTLLKNIPTLAFQRKKFKMNFEKSRECKNPK